MKNKYVFFLTLFLIFIFPQLNFIGLSAQKLTAQEDAKNNSFLYQVKQYNGTPTLFVNGKPAFYGT